MKRFSIRALLCVTAVMVSILTACSKQETTDISENSITPTPIATEQPTPEPTPEATPTPKPTPTPTPEPTQVPGMIFSHKQEYATDLFKLIIFLPEEKPESTLKQRDVDCDTLQWFNATYSIFTYQSEADYHLVGGYSDETDVLDSYVLDGLEQSWGITDRASAIESLAWLAYAGHVLEYTDTLQLMYDTGMLTDDENDVARVIYAIGEEEGWTKEECSELSSYYGKVRYHYENTGENGIDAWDYCRIMQISGNCYYAGYLTLEECLTIQLATAKVIQDEFDSWDAMNTSYLQGYSYWTYGSSAAYAHRLWAYQDLQKESDCPFATLDFNMKLEKFW